MYFSVVIQGKWRRCVIGVGRGPVLVGYIDTDDLKLLENAMDVEG